jgi:hypothetical protein
LSCKRFLHYGLLITLLGCVTPLPAQSSGGSPDTDPGTDPGRTDPGKIESKADPSTPSKRLFGVLPNYRTTDGTVPFTPIPAKQKLGIAFHDSFDWPTYVTAGALTMVTRSHDRVYGTGIESFANQYVRWSASQIIGNMLAEGVMPVALHQDPRYFRAGRGTFSSRLFGAMGQIVVAKTDSGRRTFNASEWLGNAMATGIANAYTPHMNSWSQRTETWMWMVGSDTLSNVMKEFGPDIRQRLPFHKKS